MIGNGNDSKNPIVLCFPLELFLMDVLTKVNVVFQMVMMLSAGYFRIRSALPRPVWMYPISYVAFHTYCIQVSWFHISCTTTLAYLTFCFVELLFWP